jgi:hypothetical protein
MVCLNLTPFWQQIASFMRNRCICSGFEGVGTRMPERGRAGEPNPPTLASEPGGYSGSVGWGSTTFQNRQPFTELPVMAFAAALSDAY